MALDVRLTRDTNERWGFEVVGGADEDLPLTVVKMEPSSPASRAGLQNSDMIFTINGEEAIDFTHEEACRRIAECADTLTVRVMRGLYDPVLDDQEPIFYEPGDLDPESQPTEVSFNIPQFVEPADIGSSLIEYDHMNNNLGTPFDPSVLLTESRSLTASPFLNPTKPYRPFSTEPLPEVPPLEDPIILNPDYQDQFGKGPIDIDPDYILNAHYKDVSFEGKYKLPISEQYDPDGGKQVQNAEIDSLLSKYINMEMLSKTTIATDEKITKISNVKVTEDSRRRKDDKSNEDFSSNIKEASSAVTTQNLNIRKDKLLKKVEVTARTDVETQDKEEMMITEELKYIDKMRQEMDVDQIERTAYSIVEDSIERAVSVAEEVKKEMETELNLDIGYTETVIDEAEKISILKNHAASQIQEDAESNETKATKQKTAYSVKEDSIERTSSTVEDNKTKKKSSTLKTHSESQKKQVIESNITKETDFEAIDKIASNKEHLKYAEKEVYEDNSQSQHQIISENISRKSSKEKIDVTFGETQRIISTVTTDSKVEKSEAQQRMYEVGLQTIPNIRGVVHSSYHYDLLLRTFFLHLTDVMVALSRFLLTQPIFNTSVSETHKTINESQIKSDVKDVTKTQHKVVESTKTETQKFDDARTRAELKHDRKVEKTDIAMIPPQEKHMKKRELVTPTLMEQTKIESHESMKQTKKEEDTITNLKHTKTIEKSDMKQEQKKAETKIVEMDEKKAVSEKKITQDVAQKMDIAPSELKVVAVEKHKTEEADIFQVDKKKAVSGAQMAQRTEKKISKDITQKMDAVISEFQTIAVEEDKKVLLQRGRRSRSRSHIEEEVARESDPLEWLAKVDSRRASQEISEERFSKKEFCSTDTLEKKLYEKKELREIKHKKAKTPKQMYIAIVEAHVYTNKDVIFEDAAEFSETSSVQSAEEVSTAFETMEAIQSENVLLESAVEQIDQAKISVESHELSRASAQSEATIQELEESLHMSTNLQEEEYKKETATQRTDIQEVIIQETKEAIEPVVEIEEIIKKENVSLDINESLFIAESSEINVLESKSEFTSVDLKKESAAIIEEDYRENAVVQSAVEVKEAVQIVEIEDSVEKDKVKTEVESQVQIEDVTEKIVVKVEKPDFKKEEEYAALKIVKEVETEVNNANEIIEIAEVEVKKIQMSKELQLDTSAVVIEKSKISSALEMSMESESKTTSETDISSKSSHMMVENYRSGSYMSENIVQESSFAAKSIDKQLTLRTDLMTQESIQSEPSTIDTPTPSSVPPTPLTDEYVFKLTIPLPKSRSTTPIPRDCTLSPEEEDPHIVKKKLIPHIETTIDKIVYDPPLPTPPGDTPLSPIFKTPGLFGGSSKAIYKIKFPPIYRKPGLFGGADNPEFNKEEIREIERESSLLASAIDETIKSIEEYKEEVGMESKKEVKVTEAKEETTVKTYQKSYTEETLLKSQKRENSETLIPGKVENNDMIGHTEISVAVEIPNEEAVKNEVNQNVCSESEPVTEKNIDVKIEHEIKVTNDVAKDTETSVQAETIEEKTIESNKTDISNLSSISESRIEKEINVKIAEKTIAEQTIEKTTEVEKPINIIEVKESEIENSEVSTETMHISPNTSEYKKEVTEIKSTEEENKKDPMLGFRPVVFDPESIQKRNNPQFVVQDGPTIEEPRGSPYLTESGEIIGTIQGIVDGLEEPVMDPEVAKELGKPGIPEEKIAELISGEAEMLREAHVMGLSRVLNSHMHRADDSSVDFQKIKPLIDSLKDSEVLKALNEDLARQKEEQRKKEEKRWTTFLQKPKRPSPKAKFGYHGWTEAEAAIIEEPYKVKIVKQAKPKVAPDYKPEDFETGPLPWELRAEIESTLPPIEPEEPILIPELPEYLEAVDPLPESEVPDLEDTGLPLPPPRLPTPPTIIEEVPQETPVLEAEPEVKEVQEVIVEDKKKTREDMENQLAEQLVRSVQSMVDPNAPVEQQLCQMRAQLAALAQLPEVIQQTLDLVSRQLNKMSHQEARVEVSASENYSHQEMEVTQSHATERIQEYQTTEDTEQYQVVQNGNTAEENEEQQVTIEEMQDNMGQEEQTAPPEELKRVQTPQTAEEEMRNEKMQKKQHYQAKLEAEARQIKQRGAPRVGKPTRMFGPLDPDSRPVVLPGGRRWRSTSDVYNEQLIAETLQAQSELICGKTMGFESDLLPYDKRINFMKYEKPPVSLDHLQRSETYKMVHDMDQPPLKKVEMLGPVIAEADYRERCRSITPSGAMKHLQIPQQLHP